MKDPFETVSAHSSHLLRLSSRFPNVVIFNSIFFSNVNLLIHFSIEISIPISLFTRLSLIDQHFASYNIIDLVTFLCTHPFIQHGTVWHSAILSKLHHPAPILLVMSKYDMPFDFIVELKYLSL